MKNKLKTPANLRNLNYAYGTGSYIFDKSGKRYIDGSSGPAVSCLGHGNEEVNRAVQKQMSSIAYACRSWSSTDARDELTDIVRSCIGGGLDNVVYTCGGSEAVDSALNIALQYHRGKGNIHKKKIISRQNTWHGNTLLSRSISGVGTRKVGFENEIIPVEFVSTPNVYRPPEGVNSEGVVDYCIDEIEQSILRLGPENVCAFVIEAVGGAVSGCVPTPAGYAKKVRAICDKYDIVLIADEVLCGAGRTGTWMAIEQDFIRPDIMTLAKGLNGGFLPLGAVVYNNNIHQSIMANFGAIMAGSTYSGHATCCAAAIAVQKIIAREKLLDRINSKAPYLFERLRGSFQGSSHIGDVRGRGYLIGIEIVEDKATKKPFSPDMKVYSKISDRTIDNGLICFPVAGCIDGINGDHVMLAPPFNASDKELDEIIDIFCVSLHQVISAL